MVSSGQVATHLSVVEKVGEHPHRRIKWIPPRRFWAGQASVAEVGVSPTERQVSDACQDGCQDGLRPETSPTVGPLSVAVRLGSPGRVIRQRDKCRVCHKLVVDVHMSVACPERIVVATVRMERYDGGIGSRVLHLSPR